MLNESGSCYTYVKTAVEGTAFSFDMEYTYRVPEEWLESVCEGKRILIPFGKGNRKRIGMILRVYHKDYFDVKVKPFVSVLDDEPILSEEMLSMVRWLKATTFCTYFEAVRTVLPSGLNLRFAQKYQLSAEFSSYSDLSEEEACFLENLKGCNSTGEFDLIIETAISSSRKAIVERLLEAGALTEKNQVKRKVQDDAVKMVCLSDEYLEEPQGFSLSPKQRTAVGFLEEHISASIKEICYLCNITSSVVQTLIKKGVLRQYEYETINIPEVDEVDYKPIVLTESQQKVFEDIFSMIKEEKPAGALLYGVTGSGKTSVFLRLIEETLALGKTVIMMIPEIALTPQMVSIFQKRFGETVAVIHSNLSLSQRLNEYKRLQQEQAKIAVGTRSAVFAPCKNIGLIIMDEEGERSYKSEASPRYHARDAAIKRCGYHNAVLLMASATPSVESYFYAKNGRYRLFSLTERYSTAVLPEVTIIDMNQESGGEQFFSHRLMEEMYYNLEHDEQSILLLNRRGYHTHISCPKCSEVISCPNCSIPLTYHKINNQLICHYCGYTHEAISSCPKCGFAPLKAVGAGTQRMEDELNKYFSGARILRMDTDTTFSRYAYEKNFSAFAKGEYDIMVGTQMIAKGLDFPNVTLVGVLSVDKSLFSGDFRSYERTFSLITQVVGRSGRSGKPGRAFLQTYVPEHYILNQAASQDYPAFYNEEITLRKALIYPPFCDIYMIGFVSSVEKDAALASAEFLRLLRQKIQDENPDFPLRVLGPSAYNYVRMNGKYRYKLILKCKNTQEFRRFVSELLASCNKNRSFANVTVFADINGDIG